MAKRALLDVLESTIGKYVLGLDAQSLNVAVWSGKIELTNLALDIDAVNSELSRRAREAPNLATPLRVVSGQFDNLRVEVPWARITSRPVVLKARGFHVVVEPYDHLAGEVDVAGKKRREIRREALARADEERKRRNALMKVTALDLAEGADGLGEKVDKKSNKSGSDGGGDAGPGFVGNLVRRIVENLQLEVQDFHVSLKGCGCEAGVVLGTLSVATTDENGVKVFVDRVAEKPGVTSFLHKALTIEGFGAYCDGERVSVGGAAARSGAGAAPLSGVAEDGSTSTSIGNGDEQKHVIVANLDHSYVVAPITLEASVRQCDHDKNHEYPKYLLQSKIPRLSAMLSRSQLEMTNRITAALASNKDVVRPLFPEYRPTVDIMSKGTAVRQWWKYAVRCIGRLNRRRSWAEFFIAWKKSRRYVPLYMRHVHHEHHGWVKPLADWEVQLLQSIEDDQSISTEGIMMWRNIADKQVEQEDRRRQDDFVAEMLMGTATPPGLSTTVLSHDSADSHSTRGGRGDGVGVGRRPTLQRHADNTSSIFASAQMSLSDLDDEGNPPITLTAAQLREIESVMFERSDSEVPSDSKLYDLNFTLGEFTVDLISSDRPHAQRRQYLASLHMGTAVTSFNAKADGSFTFDFTMASLRVDDRVTPRTLFPSIVQSLQQQQPSSNDDAKSSSPSSLPSSLAFAFRLAKSKSGDQELTVKMVAMEVVASQMLLKGVKDFFAFAPPNKSDGDAPKISAKEEAVVVETASGEDVFYDASEEHHNAAETLPSIVDMTAAAAASAAAVVSDALASSIVDAWNSKRESKKAWTIELDLHAPVLVLPQSSVDPMANTLVADLGRFVVVFGTNAKPPAKVTEWFDSRRLESEEEEAVDYCNLDLNQFKCLIGKAGDTDWRTSTVSSGGNDYTSSREIIEPMSLNLCIGLENAKDKGDAAGTCIVGVLPSISVAVSMPQINDVLSITGTWTEFLGTLGDGQDVPPTQSEPAIDLSQIGKQYLASVRESRVKEVEKLYVELALRRLSAKLMTGRGDSLEAHLVSLSFSTAILDDGSTTSRLAMGYVWLFDGLQVDFPRNQRIVAHSSLPRSATSYAQNGAYDIMDDLRRLGAFDEDFDGASDLAEVTITTSPHTPITTIDGVFSSLYLNFNPKVLRQILQDTAFPNDEADTPSQQAVTKVEQTGVTTVSRTVGDEDKPNADAEEIVQGRALHINAQMKGFEVLTYSPNLDLPLLRFAMTETKVYFQSSEVEMVVDLIMNNLICEDQREASLRPSFGYIINQGNSDNDDGRQDLFHVIYKQRDTVMDVDVAIGSPQIVLLPDAIVDILEFISALSPPQDIDAASNSIDDAVPKADQKQAQEGKNNATGPEASAKDTEMIVNIRTGSDCRFILVDVGSGNDFGHIVPVGQERSSLLAVQTKLADIIVLQGKVDAKIRMTSGTTISSAYELNWESIEAYTAHGRNLRAPIQLLEPSSLSAMYRTSTKNQGEDETELKLWSLASINFTVSMENVALLLTILSSFGDAFAEGSKTDDVVPVDNEATAVPQGVLSDQEAQMIERLADALESCNDAIDDGGIEVSVDAEPLGTKSESENSLERDAGSARVVRVRVAFPETTMTLINDLQGLDDGLFKLYVKDFLVGGEMHYPELRVAQTTSSTLLPAGSDVVKPVFKLELNNTVTADYFDTHSNLWAPLLLQPWETTLSATRAPSPIMGSKRLQTTVTLDSDPCKISFAETFLVSLGAANRMWSAYSFATSEAKTVNRNAATIAEATHNGPTDRRQSVLMKNITASNAARSFVTTLPYLIENHSGVTTYFEVKGKDGRRRCDSGKKEYFRFDPPPGSGVGGKRTYGQYVTQFKSLTLFIGERSITFRHLDASIHLPRQTHDLGYGRYIFTEVVRKGKATCLVISSHIELFNMTSLDFQVSLDRDGKTQDIGTSIGKSKLHRSASFKSKGQGIDTQAMTEAFGVPVNLLKNFDDDASMGEETPSLSIVISPRVEPNLKDDSPGDKKGRLFGTFELPSIMILREMGTKEGVLTTSEIVCSYEDESGRMKKSLVVQLSYQVALVGNHPCVRLYLQPRALLQNSVPVKLEVSTPMRQTVSASRRTMRGPSSHDGHPKNSLHVLEPFDVMEIYSPGPSFYISFKLGDKPIGGGTTGWNANGPISFPLGQQIASPIETVLPFVDDEGLTLGSAGGDHVFILEASDLVSYFAIDEGATDAQEAAPEGKSDAGGDEEVTIRPQDAIRKVCVVVPNFAIDHTGDVLFEELMQRSARDMRRVASEGYGTGSPTTASKSFQFGAFRLPNQRSRLILLPSPKTQLRLVHPTLDAVGARQSIPFLVQDVAFCEGGVESSAILWENTKAPSGYFAYRKFSRYGQSEIHIVPEYVVFNGSLREVRIRQQKSTDTELKSKAVGPLYPVDHRKGLTVRIEFTGTGMTDEVRVDQIGSKVCIVRGPNASPLGSVTVQTDPGKSDSRIVIKIGTIKFSAVDEQWRNELKSEQLLDGDFIRFRVRLSELQVTMNDTQQGSGYKYERNRAAIEAAFDRANIQRPSEDAGDSDDITTKQSGFSSLLGTSHSGVAQIQLQRLTFDFQRIYETKANQNEIERSQLAIVVHALQLKDCTPDSKFPVVFDSSSARSSFFDLCIRTRGPLDADLVLVDCFDLNISCIDNKPDTVSIRTDEAFVWKLLDVLNRTLVATSELAGVDLQLDFDDDSGDYSVSMKDDSEEGDRLGGDYEEYQLPRTDTLYNIAIVRVSPMKFVVSFLRQPEVSRYQQIRGVRGAKVMNYFTTKLAFTVDRAQLKFAGYAARNIKGPPDRLIATLTAVYTSRLKRKAVNLLTAISLKDWNFLTAREDGEDAYVEGDILRLTGNVAGRSAGYLLKKVGQGIDEGLRTVTGTIGDEIQYATEMVGAGAVGSGINRAVTGVGEGVGGAVKGAGHGTGKVVRGAVRGIGQAAGGVGGGAMKAVKGVGGGVMAGDAGAAFAGIGEGVSTAAIGVGQGVETVVYGTADGVQTVGHGIFHGLQSLLRGFCCCCMDGGGEDSSSSGDEDSPYVRMHE